MLQRHPAPFGLMTGLGMHVAIWLAVWASAMLQLAVGLWIALALLVARLVLLACLNREALSQADSIPQGLRFALGYVLPSVLLLGMEFFMISSDIVLSILDPHASAFIGLAYILMWFAVAIEAGTELLLSALQVLLHALRARRVSDPGAKY